LRVPDIRVLSLKTASQRDLHVRPSCLDLSESVNVSLVTPDPLDPHLLASLNGTFGSSQQVAKAFEVDLCPAYSRG
jgi:hypothetical protein